MGIRYFDGKYYFLYHAYDKVSSVYTGREDNIFWKRTGNKVEAAGAQALSERDAVPLGQDIIHSVTNPIPRLTGAIHVYGGDFFAEPRSEFDPETGSPRRAIIKTTDPDRYGIRVSDYFV